MGTLAYGQNRAISGTVVDGSGLPVIGATVMVVGNSSIGTVTNASGAYTLSVPAGSTISVSCIGYATQTAQVGQQSVYNFILQEDTEFLEETVVIGYGVQRKSDLTGAVGSVREESLKNLSTTDGAAALQGKVSGVHIINSGAPGDGASIRVRGYSSNGGSIGPLLIVDGLQVSSIQYLDPTMIESIEVLKDAASAAIYGAQAGNGVILVTTKSGQDGNASVTYTARATLQDFHKRPMMRRDDMLKYISLEYPDADGSSSSNGLSSYVNNMLSDFDYKHPYYENGVIDQDWIDAYIEPTWSQQHSLSFSGGNRNGHYFTSVNYVHQDGVVRGEKDVYKRLTAQLNADYQFFKWLQVGNNLSFEKWSTQSVSQRGYSTSFESMMLMDATTPVYWTTIDEMSSDVRNAYNNVQAGIGRPYRFFRDENGWFANTKYSDTEGSPFAKRDATDSSNGGFNINGTFFANFTPFKGFTFTSRLGFRLSQSSSHSYTAPYYIGPRGSQDNYSISAGNNFSWYYQWENFANYLFNIGKNNFTVMAGMSYRENNSDNVSGSASGADILSAYEPQFQYLNYVKGDASKSISNLPGKSASLAYFGRIIWSYDNRYQLQANFRADAFDSSKLPASNRWGYFPSFSAGWTISNEPFFKDNINTSVFNFLKLRASWGRNGNINVLSGYPYATTISLGNNWYQYSVDQRGSTFASSPNGLPNPNLRWETSEQIDLGLDARFLNNRLTLGVDWFNKQTKDLLFSVTVPPELGVGSVTINGGNVLNTGLEFELGWRDRIGELNYSINTNFSTLHNEVLELAEGAGRQTRSDASSTNYQIQTAFEKGYPVWYLRGYEYTGIAKDDVMYTDADGNTKVMFAKGAPMFTDVDGDGNISSADMMYIGQGTPTFTYGLTINLDWKGFDFTLYGSGVGGNSILPVLHRPGFKNSMKMYLDLYEDGTFPHPSKTLGNYVFWSSTANLFKGDYFRIKQLQLGYTLPSTLTKKAAISNLRFYVSLDDYFTFTSYRGLDPETASTNSTTGTGLDWGSYPTMQKIILGVNLTF
ncbi:MAG: TonB-dependent receptor [Bacteroidales bacterium]|nr:TonB-dependent receptor [Bacteroidales bacterium]MBR4817455.1 TonB-dependent receptor [Bacteroidales bacterium]MBR5055166.1 TonB-dependent receptor [Bacteroidales bacterium]